MFGQTHAGLGWVLGALAPDSDRRLRVWCCAAAILPDVDALAWLAGPQLYDRFHHTFGHNVFTGALCVALAAWHFASYPWRRRATAVALVAVCFASHLLTDMKLSGWPLHVWWPLSLQGVQFRPNLQLGHPINFWLAGIFMTLPFLFAAWRRATPLEILSVRLDGLVMNLFRRKGLACATCGRPCNNSCRFCGKPACLNHGRVDWRFRVTCPACTRSAADSGSPESASPPP